MSVPLPIPQLVPSLHVTVELGELEDHGMTAAGHRRIIPILGGTITGDVVGTILPGGADWQRVRTDGTIEIDSRYSAATDDGGYLSIRAAGIRTGSPAVLDALRRGQEVNPALYYFRTMVTIESSEHPALADQLFVAACARGRDRVEYTAYRIT
ncbi:DUF3237 domain-containing protein [Leifsonia sp. 2MCAF36]|uniref:DUF3237 domain-containing protein n=1 Tax=Leifsonia sp. 2MCAF36 TaxID=3232988 RepID=UPI003F98620B